ncbi:LytR C-terminal domain-containing protein [Bifidobacterium oedipodis]|uniref:Cell wall integrity and stress response protein 1 n=1 Tax=Bifidobacterium oedipodis TaxID=2675322 RepID=A0A7Y0EQU1_9BIFI|nr:LytR C-terminal domain-containing protein [Bifidobacterium sp. DSM 109957]NMM93641.1 cell wall integrity and stress response protein 1 [Bifidobacterium sp. DSM 109957]
MARDKVTWESYQQDVFDDPPRGPVGVHRGSRPLLVRMTPFIVVIVVAALCGLGVWLAVSGEYRNLPGPWANTSQASGKSNTSKTSDDSDTKKSGSDADDADSDADKADKTDASDSANTSDSSAQSNTADGDNAAASNSDGQNTDQSADGQANDTPVSTVNKGTQVNVINATGIQGYAGQMTDVLQQAGYTAAVPMNPSGGTLPGYTVVWYQNETDKATADDVAATLGIGTVEQASGIAAPVTVVLLN